MSAAKRTFALPLMLLALLLQGMAPGAAAAMTARMLDPFANLPICSTDLNGEAGQHAPADEEHGRAACAACVVCQVPAALSADPPALPRPPVAVVVGIVRIEIAGPRGPPRRAAQARAPPTQA